MIKNSYLIYKGPSLFNGEEIAAFVTGLTNPSANRKTGVLIQSWIISANSLPTEAIKNGDDTSVCGSCPLKGKSCYVNLVGVNNMWRNLDNLEMIDTSVLEYIHKYSGLGLRLGSYGDPAMVSLDVWQPLIQASKFSVGYTHQWRDCDQEWKNYCQASVENIEDMKEANEMGWATFRVKAKEEKTVPGEIICINQTNNFIKCNTCNLCNGKRNIAVDVHGAAYKLNHFKTLKHEESTARNF